MALTPREQAIIQFCIAFQVTSEELREIFDQPDSERGKERVAMLEAQMDALIEAIEGLSGQRYPVLMAHAGQALLMNRLRYTGAAQGKA